MSDEIPIPRDPRHQRFADVLLKGSTLVDAYMAAGFQCKRTSALQNAKRLRKNPEVEAYILALQKKAADESLLTIQEKRRFLARVVRVPLAKLDPTNQDDPNGDLIKSHSTNESETSSSMRIEKLDPLKAIQLDNELDASSPENTTAQQLVDAIRSLGSADSLPRAPLQ